MTEHPVGPRSSRDDELSGGEGPCCRVDFDSFTGRTHTVHQRLVEDRRAPGPCKGYVYGVGLARVHEAGPLLVDAEHALIERELRETVHHLVCREFLMRDACCRHRNPRRCTRTPAFLFRSCPPPAQAHTRGSRWARRHLPRPTVLSYGAARS